LISFNTILASAFVCRRNQAVTRAALLGICAEGRIAGGPPVSLGGNLLSIYETTDAVGTCEGLADDSDELKSFAEVAISTGLKHGAFFKPLPDWLQPLRRWIEETNR
jgi:hypothetical protein